MGPYITRQPKPITQADVTAAVDTIMRGGVFINGLHQGRFCDDGSNIRCITCEWVSHTGGGPTMVQWRTHRAEEAIREGII